jgi:5-bromo-4-chloroindolyl phosphate hydrolysis protein
MVKSKSVVQFYLIGLLWLAYAFLFPLYRITDYLIVSILSILLFFFSSYIISTRKGYENINTGDSYIDEMLITAIDNLEKLRLIRNAIGNENLRKQIKDLDNDSHQIIEFVKKYPDRCSKVSQFFLYYLPTTLKLINNYKELEMQGQVGDNHTIGMKKIEEFMNELVVAYHKILDDLCEDKVMETSIDIDVMEKMLQQDEYLKE